MSTNMQPLPAETLADLVSRVGDVPLSRIRIPPFPGSATEADVLRLEASADKRLCELVDGVLVEKTMGFPESLLAVFLSCVIGNFVAQHKLGIVAGSDGMVRVLPGQVRIPDVSYFSWDRLPGRQIPTTQIPAIAPDIAIEIISPSNTAAEMDRKRQDYFAAGVIEIWEVYLLSRTVEVFRESGEVFHLHEHDQITTVLLPGLTLSITELFAVLDEQG
ncbi:Uma2 family endonuclease [Anatilimnocola sp. NA78]|uniref:Uma2 family endonuclease n=1 Tax=Anatilimnocola sp. NA78 TaxID=3415683 RepID=UPI003CE5A8E0